MTSAPTPPPRAPSPRTRRPGFWGLVGGVLLLHLLLTNHVLENRVGWGRGDQPPPRIDVTFVQELKATAPPPLAPPAPAAPAEKRLAAVAAKPKAPASAPRPDGPASAAQDTDATDATEATEATEAATAAAALAPGPEAVALLAEPAAASTATAASTAVEALPPLPATAGVGAVPDLPPAASAPPAAEAVAPAPAPAPASAAASATGFAWPPSTRLTYVLTGDYRGPVNGSASVEWLRQGTRYQVHLDTSVGPVLSRHITSEGELTAQGLAPRRFDGEQKALFRDVRRWQLRFGPERVVLADGREVPTMAGAQDEASQFVQLTWLFTTRPDLLKVGGSVEMPLAISRRLERWRYDILAEETLRFRFGSVATFHLKPRRAAQGGDLTPEIWIAPTLQYLPVRILIRDGKGNWIDLSLEKPPLQAAQPADPPPAPAR